MVKKYIISIFLCTFFFAFLFTSCSTAPETSADNSVENVKEETEVKEELENNIEKPEEEPKEEVVIEDTDPENSVFTQLDDEGASSDFVALLLNQPGDDVLEKIEKLDTYSYDQSGNTVLVVPRYEGSNVELNTLRVNENGELEKAGTIYTKENIEDGYALFLFADRPEGMPSLSVSVTYEGMTSRYMLNYEGKSGTPELEYVETSFNFDDIDDTVKFNYREAAHVFNLDHDTIISKFGEPEESNLITYLYMAAIELKYPSNLFRVEQTSGYVYEAEICDNTIIAPRDLGISSTSAAVLSAFPNESDGTRVPMNDDSGYEYEVLYKSTEDSGAAIYDGVDLKRVEYRSGAVVIVFEFEDDIVTKIIYKTEF